MVTSAVTDESSCLWASGSRPTRSNRPSDFGPCAASRPGQASFEGLSIRHDGRILAAGTRQGVVLWDLASGAELGFLTIGYTPHLTFEASGDLLTSGEIGVRRWPVRLDLPRGEFRLGPPRTLPLASGDCELAADRLGRVVAAGRPRLCPRLHPRPSVSAQVTRRRPQCCRQPGRRVDRNRQPWSKRRPGLARA